MFRSFRSNPRDSSRLPSNLQDKLQVQFRKVIVVVSIAQGWKLTVQLHCEENGVEYCLCLNRFYILCRIMKSSSIESSKLPPGCFSSGRGQSNSTRGQSVQMELAVCAARISRAPFAVYCRIQYRCYSDELMLQA